VAILNCRWTRLVSKTFSDIAEFSLDVECTDVKPCGQKVKWHTTEAVWRRRWTTSTDIQTTTTHRLFMGTDSDTVDDLYCLTKGRP
jgi:hypothetical protein